jgi:hypothetical protein
MTLAQLVETDTSPGKQEYRCDAARLARERERRKRGASREPCC